MRLIVLPGGGNPSHPTYHDAYELIRSEAASYGYESVDITTRWPGHQSADSSDETGVTLHGAVGVALNTMGKQERKGSYDVLGRSFGASVAAKCALTEELSNLRKMILWGPTPYWLSWKMWRHDLSKSQKKGHEKGIHADETFFPSLTPFEVMLPQLQKPTTVATGTDDDVSPPSYLKYLQSLVTKRENFVFRTVDGAPHAVGGQHSESVKQRYSQALFSDFD